MQPTFEAVTSVKLGDSAYDQISRALMSGRLKPGTKLTIRALADSLGTSSTPVRDAVTRLIQDNALEQRSLRDVRVPLLTESRFREIIEIRVELEAIAARHASDNASADDIAALEEIIDRNEAAFREEDWDAASGCNQEFHFKIVNIARMEILGGMLSALWLQTGPVVSSFYQRGGRSMVDEHYAIVAAIKAGDADAAARVMKRDVAGSVEGIVAYLRELAQ